MHIRPLHILDRALILVPIAMLWVWHKVWMIFGPRCRFHPSCSCYATDCLKSHGFLKGAALALNRVFRCSPRFAGGEDYPPPNPLSWAEILRYKGQREDRSGAVDN